MVLIAAGTWGCLHGSAVAATGEAPVGPGVTAARSTTPAPKPRIVVSAKPTSVQAGSRLVVSGRVIGKLAGPRRSLRIVLEERTGRRQWTGRASVRLTTGSRFVVSWRVPGAIKKHRLWLRLMRGNRVLATSPHWFLSARGPSTGPAPGGAGGPGGGGGTGPGGGGGGANPPADGTAVIPLGGGAVSLPGVGSVAFAAGSFESPATVRLATSRDPDIAQRFADDTTIFRSGERIPYELLVTVPAQPLVNARVTFDVPSSFLAGVPATAEIRAFYLNAWSDAGESLESFELLPERFTGSPQTVTVTLPAYAFSQALGTDGAFHAVILLSTTPTAQSSPRPAAGSARATTSTRQRSRGASAGRRQAAGCQGTTIGSPLDGNLEVRSPFGPRTHPVTGAQSFHRGVDLRAPTGASVYAVAGGTVESVHNSATGGYMVVVRHTDGSASSYMHLQQGSAVAAGTPVAAGQRIAGADSTGQVTGPHLHLEYAPNGQIFQNDQKVDPMECIGATVSGSITVGDNGALADDAFSVAINGLVVCTTTIGATNTCGIGNLRPGIATLTITVVIAPDDVGTYAITLGDGLTFAGGGTFVSNVLPQGGSTSYQITIPQPTP